MDIKEATAEVYKQGLNIYALINRYKKVSKTTMEIPSSVIIGVCENYLKNKSKILSSWPWFIETLEREFHKFNANKNVEEGKVYKNAPTSLAFILAGISKNN